MGEHVFAESRVDAALVALAGGFEEGQDFGVEAQCDLLLVFFGDQLGDAAPAGSLALVGDVAQVDILVAEIA